MDLTQLRNDFEVLNKRIKGSPIIYFDNACMSLRPRQVVEAMNRYYVDMPACAGRSNHRLARAVNDAVLHARKTVQQFIHARYEEEVIFTRNTSEGLNLIAQILALKAGDVVITSDKEHNSNLVPWLRLQRDIGIRHVVLPSKADNTFDMTAFETMLEHYKPKLVSMVHTSNLDGVTFPLEEIINKAHGINALVMVDGAQSVPHNEINVRELDVDFLAFSGHKMCGPSGMGVLYGKRELLEKTDGFMVGGDTVEYTTYTDYKLLPLPEKYEAGLQNYAGIIGLGAAIDYLRAIGLKAIQTQEQALNTIITKGLSDEERISLIGPNDARLRSGIYAFTVDGADPHQIALLLDESYGIMVRSGQHCVHSWFHDRDIKGSVRASMYFYNTEDEANRFVAAMKSILSVI